MSLPVRTIVSWSWVESGGSFMEVVLCTPEQADALRDRLALIDKITEDIDDVYVGPEQETATGFEEFLGNLQENPVIEAAEETLAMWGVYLELAGGKSVDDFIREHPRKRGR